MAAWRNDVISVADVTIWRRIEAGGIFKRNGAKAALMAAAASYTRQHVWRRKAQSIGVCAKGNVIILRVASAAAYGRQRRSALAHQRVSGVITHNVISVA